MAQGKFLVHCRRRPANGRGRSAAGRSHDLCPRPVQHHRRTGQLHAGVQPSRHRARQRAAGDHRQGADEGGGRGIGLWSAAACRRFSSQLQSVTVYGVCCATTGIERISLVSTCVSVQLRNGREIWTHCYIVSDSTRGAPVHAIGTGQSKLCSRCRKRGPNAFRRPSRNCHFSPAYKRPRKSALPSSSPFCRRVFVCAT